MRHAAETLARVRRAARVPGGVGASHAGLVLEYATTAEGRGLQVIIAGAGGAAHLPGMAAAQTMLPVLGVPMRERRRSTGMDSLLSIVQMPAGIPVGTLAIGKAGRDQRGAAGGGDPGDVEAGAAGEAEAVQGGAGGEGVEGDAGVTESCCKICIANRWFTWSRSEPALS